MEEDADGGVIYSHGMVVRLVSHTMKKEGCMVSTHPSMKNIITYWLVKHQAGGAVGAGCQFLVEHV